MVAFHLKKQRVGILYEVDIMRQKFKVFFKLYISLRP